MPDGLPLNTRIGGKSYVSAPGRHHSPFQQLQLRIHTVRQVTPFHRYCIAAYSIRTSFLSFRPPTLSLAPQERTETW